MWGSGALFGTTLTGVAMNLLGSVGFPVSIAAVYLVLVTTCFFVQPVRSRAQIKRGKAREWADNSLAAMDQKEEGGGKYNTCDKANLWVQFSPNMLLQRN